MCFYMYLKRCELLVNRMKCEGNKSRQLNVKQHFTTDIRTSSRIWSTCRPHVDTFFRCFCTCLMNKYTAHTHTQWVFSCLCLSLIRQIMCLFILCILIEILVCRFHSESYKTWATFYFMFYFRINFAFAPIGLILFFWVSYLLQFGTLRVLLLLLLFICYYACIVCSRWR